MLTDDTGTVTVGVPSSWADVETSPLDDGPRIVASTDIDQFIDSFDVPGVIYSAWNFTDAIEMMSERVGVVTGGQRGCAAEQELAYDNGVFVGTERVYTGCGSFGVGEYHVIMANPADHAFTTAVLLIKLTGPEQLPLDNGYTQPVIAASAPDDAATLDGLRSSFNWVSDAAAPAAFQSTDEARQTVAGHFGLTVTDAQAQCIVDNPVGVDPTFADGADLLLVALNCGASPMAGG